MSDQNENTKIVLYYQYLSSRYFQVFLLCNSSTYLIFFSNKIYFFSVGSFNPTMIIQYTKGVWSCLCIYLGLVFSKCLLHFQYTDSDLRKRNIKTNCITSVSKFLLSYIYLKVCFSSSDQEDRRYT